jgi:DNA-binding NarL/FixJ family response regulator
LGIETLAVRHNGREPSERREPTTCASVAVIDELDAIHAAVELWCSQAQPPIQVAGNYFSAEQFLAEHASSAASNVGAVVLELQMDRCRVDFSTLDHLVARRFRVIVYSHIATDEVILTSLDRGAVTYFSPS